MTRTATVLGLWQPVKKLMNLVWSRLLNPFWGPLLHFLEPKSTLNDVSTYRIHQLFAYTRLAYSVVKDDFCDLIESEDITPTTRHLLLNLKDMFEYYTELVSSQHHYITSSCVTSFMSIMWKSCWSYSRLWMTLLSFSIMLFILQTIIWITRSIWSF